MPSLKVHVEELIVMAAQCVSHTRVLPSNVTVDSCYVVATSQTQIDNLLMAGAAKRAVSDLREGLAGGIS